ncbi:uncharacterized protein M6B38_259630 [Iris pallida]|uniref:Large ribosomal subunit protein uL23m n=1 Tax=Iris pallida TaxID=29817 RepID=A0AAX6IEV7_IRIPA|nr:uncharacterized protein M6B38_259630 [Iris pallida]
MGSRLGRRVIHFANLPIKVLLPPPPFDCIREFALKTIPSASKIEIRRVLESLYGFQVEDVRTLNMEGKKRKVAGYLAAKPDYKKAYITLKSPLSISPDLFPIPWVKEAMEKKLLGKKKPSVVVEDPDGTQSKTPSHWLHDDHLEQRRRRDLGEHRHHPGSHRRPIGGRRSRNDGGNNEKKKKMDKSAAAETKFPWSSMSFSSSGPRR